MKNKKHFLKFAGLAVFLALAAATVKYFGISEIFHPAMIKEKVLEFGILAPAVYMAVYALATLVFIPGAPMTIAGGALFGSVFGTFYVVIGATAGAILAFLLSRTLGRDFVGALENGKFQKLAEYDGKIEKNGFSTVLFLRFVPLVPFNGLNFALGLTKVKFRDYALGTILGIIPGTFAYVYLGDSVASLRVWNIVGAIILLTLLTLLSFGTIFLKRKKSVK